jgi:hypothetical protein
MLRMPILPIVLLAPVLLAIWPARADEAAPRVTTDNAEYCEALAARLAASPQPVAEASRDLGEEGRRLCANGHVRTGIAKLRRALRATRAELRSE